MSSREVSRETIRRKPINGGTWLCSRCKARKLPSNAYCREHKIEYQREWRANRSRELKRLRALEKPIAELPEEAHTDH